jgi:hypothetical protein
MLLLTPPSYPCDSLDETVTWDLGAGPALQAGYPSGGDVIVVPVKVPNPEDFRNNVELQLEYSIAEERGLLRDPELDFCLQEGGGFVVVGEGPPVIVFGPCDDGSVRYESTRSDHDTLNLTHKSPVHHSEPPLMSLVCLLCTPGFSRPCYCSPRRP